MKEITAISNITAIMRKLTTTQQARVLRFVADWMNDEAVAKKEVADFVNGRFVNGEGKPAASVGDGTAKS